MYLILKNTHFLLQTAIGVLLVGCCQSLSSNRAPNNDAYDGAMFSLSETDLKSTRLSGFLLDVHGTLRS